MTTQLLTAPRPVLHLAHEPGWGQGPDYPIFESTEPRFGYHFVCIVNPDGTTRMSLTNSYADNTPTYSSILDLGAHLPDLADWLTDIARVTTWATVNSRDWDAARQAFATA
jgi:hypothetical protein